MSRPAGSKNHATRAFDAEFRRALQTYDTIDAALSSIVDDVAQPIDIRKKAILYLAGVLAGRLARLHPEERIVAP